MNVSTRLNFTNANFDLKFKNLLLKNYLFQKFQQFSIKIISYNFSFYINATTYLRFINPNFDLHSKMCLNILFFQILIYFIQNNKKRIEKFVLHEQTNRNSNFVWIFKNLTFKFQFSKILTISFKITRKYFKFLFCMNRPTCLRLRNANFDRNFKI